MTHVQALRGRPPAVRRFSWLGLLALGAVLLPVRGFACDLCAIYSATELRESRTGVQIGVGQQFTRFDDLQDDGDGIPNPAGEYLNSAITQIFLGYNFDPRWGVQLNLPIISRTFRRVHDGHRERGDETGVGDLSLLGTFRPYSYVSERTVIQTSLFGGLKLPSGSPDRLREELDEDHHDDGEEPDDDDEHHGFEAHGGSEDVASGIHGHDLALGSGSVDGIIGGRVFLSWDRLFWTTAVQYLMRTQGRFDYRYANDVLWQGGPGVFVLLDDAYSLTARFLIAGERKGQDELAGDDVGDTALTAVALGPAFACTWGTSLAADVALEIPVLQDNSGVQIVSEYRLRGGISWRF
jgi:hypothetical protein